MLFDLGFGKVYFAVADSVSEEEQMRTVVGGSFGQQLAQEKNMAAPFDLDFGAVY